MSCISPSSQSPSGGQNNNILKSEYDFLFYYGNAITSSASGFVAFPNVDAGSSSITVTPPSGQTCIQYPAGEENKATVDIVASEATVVFFQCE